MISIKIVYDNRSINKRFVSAWGFSCFVNGANNILFDTGGRGDILLHNMEELGINLSNITDIFISHIHGDHTGGLVSILKSKANLTVWIPDSFSDRAKFDISSYGAKVKAIDSASYLFDNLYSTGQLGRSPKEHALILDTEKGLILITGCAHPGIANMVIKTINYINKNIHLLLGGFHLQGYDKKDIEHIIGLLKDMKVEKIAPCHCTGEYAMNLFKKYYQQDYIDVRAGSIIKI